MRAYPLSAVVGMDDLVLALLLNEMTNLYLSLARSNVMLGRVPSLARHPMRKLFDAGVTVTVATDDALIFGSSLSEEFLALHRAALFTPQELDTIRLNGLRDVG